MIDYDINDYKTKTELTAQKLYTTVIASLRSFRDLKHLEQANRLIKAAQEQLIQSAKMASLGEMSAVIAHELRQPLTKISLLSQLNLEYLKQSNLKKCEENLNIQLEQVSHASKIIKNLMRGVVGFSLEKRSSWFKKIGVLVERGGKILHNPSTANSTSSNSSIVSIRLSVNVLK